jgi:DNA-binding NarL/FixJ family response regulator
MLRILIADNHDIVRAGERELIEAHPGWVVCGEAADGQTALEIAARERPDVAVLAVALPLLNGVALTQRLRRTSPSTKVLLFTVHDDDETVSAGLAAGAQGYLLKADSGRCLENAIAALEAKRLYFSPLVSEFLLRAALPDLKERRLRFTPRELEVGQLIAEGRSNPEIACRLAISVKTVDSHRAAAMRKARVRTRAEFVRFAIKHSMIQP